MSFEEQVLTELVTRLDRADERLRNDRIDAVAYLRAYTDALAEVFTFARSYKVYIPDQAPVIRHKAAHTIRQRLGSFTSHDTHIA